MWLLVHTGAGRVLPRIEAGQGDPLFGLHILGPDQGFTHPLDGGDRNEGEFMMPISYQEISEYFEDFLEKKRTPRLSRGNLMLQRGLFRSTVEQQRRKQEHPKKLQELNRFLSNAARQGSAKHEVGSPREV